MTDEINLDPTVTTSDRAFELNLEIKSIRNQAERVVQLCSFELGKRLKEMRDGRLFEQLGFKTFLAYLNDPEIQFSQATSYNSISLYEKYQLKLNVPTEETNGISVRRLVELLPVIDQENVSEWLSKARSLSSVDLEKEIHEFKQTKEMTKADFIPFPKIIKCHSCKGWIIESENFCTCPK